MKSTFILGNGSNVRVSGITARFAGTGIDEILS